MLDRAQLDLLLPDWSKLQWYYAIELAPGVTTNGFGFNNIALTRRMLGNIDLKGRSALNVSAMEGAMSTIMARRGARVMATDAIDVSARVRLVQCAYGVAFEYYPYMPLHRFAERVFEIQASRASFLALLGETARIDEIGPNDETYGFDVVLSSGVMYHVLNPIDHLMTYRKLCKLGGLVIVETAATLADDVSFVHVMRPGQPALYDNGATWFVTTAAMDLFMRACFLEPIAFCYLDRMDVAGITIARVGVVARAVARRPFDQETTRELQSSEVFRNLDFAGLQPAARLTGRVARPLAVGMDDLHSARQGLPVAGFDAAAPLAYTDADVRLSLGDW